MTPYYEREGITIYHGDCLNILPAIDTDAVSLLVTDPPYGIAYRSNKTGHHGGTALDGIAGDGDTSLRDAVLAAFPCDAVVFGTWKRPKPHGTRAVLTWDKGIHVGMGNLKMPWKPNTEEIYVIGDGFRGHRGSSVLSFHAPVSWNSTSGGRKHPHQKPVALMAELIGKHPAENILDPFMGSGATLEAARMLGRKCVGIEIEERYCEIAAKRLENMPLALFNVTEEETE